MYDKDSPIDMDRVVQLIDQTRRYKCLRTEEVFQRGGLHSMAYHRVVNGTSRNPSVHTMARIAKGLDVPISTILGLSEKDSALHPLAYRVALLLTEELNAEIGNGRALDLADRLTL